MSTTSRCLAAALIVAAGLGCRDAISPPGDVPGTLIVSLQSGNPAAGAIFLTVRGPSLSAAVVGGSAYTTFAHLTDAGDLRVIVVGDAVAPGPLFTVPVAAMNRPSAYSVRIEQVATRDDALRTDLSGYGVFVSATR